MKLVRWILRGIILFLDSAIPVKSCCVRSEEETARIQKELSSMAIYQFEACPFCVKVRRGLRRLNLEIEYRDAKNDMTHKNDLTQMGGRHKVPCLRIQKEGKDEWIYKSEEILKYFGERFPCTHP